MNLYTFKDYINKINEGLIKTYDIDKTINDSIRTIKIYNIDFDIKKLDNNTFELNINNFDRIKNVDLFLRAIMDKIYNLYGWFPSKMEATNFFGNKKSFKYDENILLRPSNNITNVNITFESKFDKIFKDIPEKLYHLSIQQYENDILNKGILSKSKSKLTNHDYDGRIYLCGEYEYCKSLINQMKLFYVSEKDDIIYNSKNGNKTYNKDTKWVIFEIDSKLSNIDVLYNDPNYIHGFYYLGNIPPVSIKILDKE
jgi:hypothetical protein